MRLTCHYRFVVGRNSPQLDRMHAQEFELEPGNEHANSTNFVFSVISLASNLLLSPETHGQFVQNEDSEEFLDLHPISNFISFENLSPSHRAFLTPLIPIEIPQAVQEALKSENGRKVMEEEMLALEKNQTWKIVELPKGKQTGWM